MELHKLHITDLSSGAVSHGNTVRRGDGRIGRIAVNVACSAGGQQHGSAGYGVHLSGAGDQAYTGHSS